MSVPNQFPVNESKIIQTNIIQLVLCDTVCLLRVEAGQSQAQVPRKIHPHLFHNTIKPAQIFIGNNVILCTFHVSYYVCPKLMIFFLVNLSKFIQTNIIHSVLCDTVCLLRADFRLKALLHWVHLNGFSPVWILMCFFRSVA